MKLGIIGSGMIVRHFLPQLSEIEKLEICSLLSTTRSLPKAEELAAQYHIDFVTDSFDDFISSGIDTVYVAVPNYLHYEYTRKVLEKGLNAIVEKPMVCNLREAEELRDIAVREHCFLFEAITTLYMGNYQKIAEWLPRIGTVKIVTAEYSQYSSRYNAFRNGEVLPAFDNTKAGGALMDLNVYNIHYVAGLFGKPKSLHYHANVERNIDTSGVLVMDYDGFTAICVGAKDSQGTRGCQIQGTDGIIRTDLAANLVGKTYLNLYDGTSEEFDDGNIMKRAIVEFNAFIDAIERNDHDFCLKMLEKSIVVADIMTQARKCAGVVFPADQQ